MSVRVESHTGPRSELRPLFEEAEDSPAQLESYLEAGQVLVAVADDQIVGHLQLVEGSDSQQAEIKNMAVETSFRGRGIGRTLIRAAVDLALAQRRSTLVVATAAADVGNLRFYQRAGFRMRSIERDAFTPDTGYPTETILDGIELRDRVWLDRDLGADER
jgi:GNAT superfamily N-acetyltransferase